MSLKPKQTLLKSKVIKYAQKPQKQAKIQECLSTDESDDQNVDAKKPKLPRKQKVQLCRKYMENGFCPYYERCKFAHGSHQLRKHNKSNMRYKTKQCGAYFADGFCSYGDRCNFKHSKKNVISKLENMPEMLGNFGVSFMDNFRKTSWLLQKVIQNKEKPENSQ